MVIPLRTTGTATPTIQRLRRASCKLRHFDAAPDRLGFDRDAARYPAQRDTRAVNREIQAMAGEMQARDLQPLPQRRLDGRDSQPSPRCVGLEAEKRVDDRERRGGAPVLRAAA